MIKVLESLCVALFMFIYCLILIAQQIKLSLINLSLVVANYLKAEISRRDEATTGDYLNENLNRNKLLTSRPSSMGNSQTTGIEKSERNAAEAGLTSTSSTTFGGSIRSRRGSKVKVFGLLGQKKSPKEPATPTTPTATVTVGWPQNVASTTSSATKAIGRISSIDEETEAELHQKHDAVVRQLEFQQMEIRAKQTTQKSNKSKFFSRKLLSNDNVKSYRTEKVSIHKKRPAPKPPSATNEMNLSQTTTDKLDETVADVKGQNENVTNNDHRVFIENLFDSTLQLQTTSSETIVNESVSSKIKEKPMTTTTTPHKKDNDKTNTTTTDTILSDTTISDNDIDDDFQNNQMATSLTLMMMMSDEGRGGVEVGVGKGGGRSHYSISNDNCDIVVLRDLSSSSDSLFTDPLTPPQSTTSATAPVDCSTAEPCSTTFDDIDDVDDDLCDVEDDDNHAETNSDEYEHKSNQTHTEKTFCTPASATQLPISLKELTANTTLISRATAAAVTGREEQQQNQHQQRRPLSDISITSGDTSGILSPTTAKAIVELQKRHQADKLSLLSVAKTTYLELLPADTTATQTESSPELETESPDEQMALHLGKKLAQVLSGSSSNASGNGGNANSNSGVMTTASTTGSSMPDNITCCNMVTGTNELFNIAKAKKIELPSLSSRLVATASQITPAAAPAEILETNTGNIIASTDAKHLPTLQSQSPALPTSISAACPTAAVPATTTPTETQSTVIISFKSSQTPVQSQPPLNITGIEQQHTPAVATPFYNDDTINETMYYAPPTPSLVSNNNNNLTYASITAQMGSPLCTPRTPKNNVLKKVASFTLEKAAGGSANKNNGDPNSGMTGQLENVGSKRSTFVPEKLSFAAYEKFEGQMLMNWFISSLQNNCNHLSEQDISMLTLQYCNNLINVGVLKQISEKNDLETFKPFQMYQWTHTEAPTTSQILTPGKLDKVTSWPYCSTPTSGVSRIPKAIQVDTPHTERDNGFLQVLRKRLLSCSTIAEVHIVINDMLSAGESLRRPSKRSVLLTDLLNASEATVYQYDKNVTGTSSGCESGVQDAGVQTEVSQAIVKFVCSKCKDTNIERQQYETIAKCDKEVQVGGDTHLDSKELTMVTSEAMRPSPPPPPPPPLAASVIAPPPPPPPPPSLLPPPPPPPPPSSVGPPPPPPPSSSSATNTLALNTSTVPPPPPPGTVKTPSTTTPAPLPNPAEGGWFNQANTLRKTAVNPPKPMKPLYWTRIVTQPPPPKPAKPIAETSTTVDVTDSSSPGTSPDDPVSSESPSVPKEIWQEIDETCLDNIDEFTELFSREAVVPKVVPKIKKAVRVRPIKVLDSKRSQNVGILLRSSHVDFCEIEHAIYHVDTSVVSLETLQQINKNKATNEELERIKEQGDIPLDEPEQFLLKISQISMFTERISCMVFMAEFEETATLIERKLEVVMQLSQFLTESEELKLIFAIILTLGNYMNGGNRQRGQADGFTLEILSKLKDVKSKDSQTTLLHFIVRTYIGRKRKEGVQLLEIPLPIPEPSDVERATQVDFDEVKGQITKLNDQLNAKKRTTDKVIIHSTCENLEPFKSKMEEFIKNASKEVDKLYKELEDCREVFIETMKFYHYAPKSGTLEQCTPNKFFEHWTNFTNDFKDIMKKEIAILWNELLKKTKDVQTRKTVKTTKVKPGCLKERIMRLNKK